MHPILPLSIACFLCLLACSSPNPTREIGVKPSAQEKPSVSLLPRSKKILAEDFLDAPVTSLEANLGAPAFIRREGSNFFHRYDRHACHIVAIVTQNPAGQKVVISLSIIPPQKGGPALTLDACLDRDF